MRARGRTIAALLLASGLAGCHDFGAAYRDCFDGGRCTVPGTDAGDAGELPDAGPTPRAGVCFTVADASVCWESPTPFGWDVYGVAARGPADIWFVGEHGMAAHFDGGAFEVRLYGVGDLLAVATDGHRVLAMSPNALVDLVSGAAVAFSQPDVARQVSATTDGAFVVTGSNMGAGANVPVVYLVDAGTLGLQLLHSDELTLGTDVAGCAGPQQNLICALKSSGPTPAGRLWTQSGGTWNTSLDQDGGADFFAVAVDTSMQQWVGSTDVYFAGPWAMTPSSFNLGGNPGERVNAIAGGDFVSIATADGRGLRCSTPQDCREAVVTPGVEFLSTAIAGQEQYFTGRGGYMLRGAVDAGFATLSATRGEQVTDLWQDADGGVWATLTGNGVAELWHRDATQWTPFYARTGTLNTVARVGGILFLGADDGIIREESPGIFSPAPVYDAGRQPIANDQRVFSLRPVGDGGWAVGRTGFSIVFTGGQWVQLDDGTATPELTLRHILDLGGGAALAVGSGGNSTGTMVALAADGGSSVVDAGVPLPLRLEGVARLSDGGVLACSLDGTMVVGTVEAGFTMLSSSQVPSCLALVTAADGGLYAGTTTGIARLRVDPMDATIMQVATDYPFNRWTLALISVSDGLLFGGDLNAIIRVQP